MGLFKKVIPVSDRLEPGTNVKFKSEDPEYAKYNNKKAVILYELPEDDTNCECYCYRIQFNRSKEQLDAYDYELFVVV